MVRPVLKKSAKNAKKTKKITVKSLLKKGVKKVKNKVIPKVKVQKTVKAPLKNKTKGGVAPKKGAAKKSTSVKKGKKSVVDKNKKQLKPTPVKTVKKNDVPKSHHLKSVKNNTVLKTRETNKMKSPLTKVVEPAHYHSEEYMTSKDQSHFREILLNWKRQLLGEMERTVHQMQDEVAVFADPNDRATQEEEFSIELRTRDRERKLIKKIEEALERLSRNDYGYCEDCGVEIGLKRLEARPTATLCIDCKTIEEIREKSSAE